MQILHTCMNCVEFARTLFIASRARPPLTKLERFRRVLRYFSVSTASFPRNISSSGPRVHNSSPYMSARTLRPSRDELRVTLQCSDRQVARTISRAPRHSLSLLSLREKGEQGRVYNLRSVAPRC